MESYLTHDYKEKLKGNVYKSIQVPGGKLPRLAGTQFDFPCIRRVKSVPTGRVKISSRQTGNCKKQT